MKATILAAALALTPAPTQGSERLRLAEAEADRWYQETVKAYQKLQQCQVYLQRRA